MMMSSETSPPVSMIFFASSPGGVWALTAARSMSPVEIWGMPNFSVMNAACVPLPAPGGPSRINRMNTSLNYAFQFLADAAMQQILHRRPSAVSGHGTNFEDDL